MATDPPKKLFSDGYHCVLVGDVWHLIQGQFSPPPSLLDGGAWTLCTIWANFKRGLTKRRPNCPKCLGYVLEWEAKHGTSSPVSTVKTALTLEEIKTTIDSLVGTLLDGGVDTLAEMDAEDLVIHRRYEMAFDKAMDEAMESLLLSEDP
jgi:hypothetical protein